MKIAYLCSHYPAPSHTFIQREVLELEKLGVDIVRFSVRRSRSEDQLDDTARIEASKTRSVLPLTSALFPALLWLLFTHPMRAFTTLWLALRSAHGAKSLLKWCAYFIEAIQLAHWLDKDRVHHLHCHFGNSGSNTAWLAARLASVTFSITFHGIDLDEPETFHHREKLVDAAFAVCISDFGKSRLLQNVDHKDAEKVAVVRCGIPVPDDKVIPAPPRKGKIICVARLSPEKGHHILLDALGILVADKVGFHCTLVGSGPLEQDLLAEVSRLGLGSHVTMAGAVPNDQVARMIAASDLSVLASYGEGIPIALLESLSWKRPFVATSVGGIPEIAPAGASGLLVEPGCAASVAESLKRLLEDQGLAAALADAGKKLIAKQHDPVRSAEAMRRLFQSADTMGRRWIKKTSAVATK